MHIKHKFVQVRTYDQNITFGQSKISPEDLKDYTESIAYSCFKKTNMLPNTHKSMSAGLQSMPEPTVDIFKQLIKGTTKVNSLGNIVIELVNSQVNRIDQIPSRYYDHKVLEQNLDEQEGLNNNNVYEAAVDNVAMLGDDKQVDEIIETKSAKTLSSHQTSNATHSTQQLSFYTTEDQSLMNKSFGETVSKEMAKSILNKPNANLKLMYAPKYTELKLKTPEYRCVLSPAEASYPAILDEQEIIKTLHWFRGAILHGKMNKCKFYSPCINGHKYFLFTSKPVEQVKIDKHHNKTLYIPAKQGVKWQPEALFSPLKTQATYVGASVDNAQNNNSCISNQAIALLSNRLSSCEYKTLIQDFQLLNPAFKLCLPVMIPSNQNAYTKSDTAEKLYIYERGVLISRKHVDIVIKTLINKLTSNDINPPIDVLAVINGAARHLYTKRKTMDPVLYQHILAKRDEINEKKPVAYALNEWLEKEEELKPALWDSLQHSQEKIYIDRGFGIVKLTNTARDTEFRNGNTEYGDYYTKQQALEEPQEKLKTLNDARALQKNLELQKPQDTAQNNTEKNMNGSMLYNDQKSKSLIPRLKPNDTTTKTNNKDINISSVSDTNIKDKVIRLTGKSKLPRLNKGPQYRSSMNLHTKPKEMSLSLNKSKGLSASELVLH